MQTIASRRNPVVGAFRALARGRAADERRVLLEGRRLLDEARAARLPIEIVAIDRRLLESAPPDLALGLADLEAAGTRIVSVPGQVMDALSPVSAPSGIVAIAECRPATLDEALDGGDPLVLALVDLQDPGNVGAAIRAAEAGGATGILTSGGTADPFGWKALRGAMGSSFRLPVAPRQPPAVLAAAARDRGLKLVATIPRGARPLHGADLTVPTLLLLGGEGAGLPPELTQVADEVLSIPMRPPVESLNVAVSAALLVYEAQRQRSHGRY